MTDNEVEINCVMCHGPYARSTRPCCRAVKMGDMESALVACMLCHGVTAVHYVTGPTRARR